MKDPSELEEHIFAEALIVPPGERERYLDNACQGNIALRERIEALILAHESAGMFMAPREGASSDTSRSPPPTGPVDREGTRIGRYKLLQKLGEGGCGVVWMAEQMEPVRRRVALKVIKLGMDTKNVIARFEAERQALALMDHPNIARVLEAGATDAGRPFFVMELVPGVAITKYCDQHNLATSARLGLFVQVCQAVQHAHQKGVIHRDLKPSNILVTLHDGEPLPKVIDFGIAKATQGRLTDHTLFTAFEQFIGTPAYMSPEQAEMSGIDIDTRSDIYSLGVLLYELLTGRPPFDPKTLLQAGLDEIRRIIREVEPVKPSTRLNTLADADRDTIARQRGIASTQLSVLLRGDLDWIVMKALEKNRNRRYETANGLAMDIQRHLQNEPVAARPPTTAYRISRLIRRNRLAVIAASAVALALIIGTIVSATQAMRAKRAEHAANLERRRALEEQARAEDLLGFMLGDLRTQLAKVGRLDVLESASNKAMSYFSARKAAGLDDPSLARYAKALTQIGEIRIDQARYAEAATAFSEAYNYNSALVARHPHDGDMLFERGQAEFWNGFVQWSRGDLPTARKWYTQYRDTARSLADLDSTKSRGRSELAHGQHNLAGLQMEIGDFDTAQNEFLSELKTLSELQKSNPDDFEISLRISDVHSWLGDLAEQQGNYSDAAGQYSTQTAQLERLVQKDPGTARWRYLLANAHLYDADLAIATGKIALATTELDKSQQLLNELVSLDPGNRRWKYAKLTMQLKQAVVMWKNGNLSTAMPSVDEILSQLESLSASEPSGRGFTWQLATAWRLVAQMRKAADRKDASVAIARAIELGERLTHEGKTTDRVLGEFALAHAVAAGIAVHSDTTTAKLHWQRAWELVEPKTQKTRNWRLLDPAARAKYGLGITSEAIAIIKELNELGYVPVEPWPEKIPLSTPQPQPR